MKNSPFVLKILLLVLVDLLILNSVWIILNLPSLSIPISLPPIITTAIGTFAFTLSARILYGEWKKPYLKIVEFDKLKASDKTTYWRVKIQNEGKSGAENCCGNLELLGKFQNEDYKIEGRVSWARNQNPESLIVNSGDTQFLDVLITVYDTEGNLQRIQFPTEEGYDLIRPLLKKIDGDWVIERRSIFPNEIQNGEWKNLIRLTSNNGAVKERKFFWEIIDNDLKLKFSQS